MAAALKIKVSSKGQIVIPAEVRRYFKVLDGGNLICEFKAGKLILTSEEEAFKERKKAFLAFADEVAEGIEDPIIDAMAGQRR